jgi:hypothetical protein
MNFIALFLLTSVATQEWRQAELIAGRNVLTPVPLNDSVLPSRSRTPNAFGQFSVSDDGVAVAEKGTQFAVYDLNTGKALYNDVHLGVVIPSGQLAKMYFSSSAQTSSGGSSSTPWPDWTKEEAMVYGLSAKDHWLCATWALHEPKGKAKQSSSYFAVLGAYSPSLGSVHGIPAAIALPRGSFFVRDAAWDAKGRPVFALRQPGRVLVAVVSRGKAMTFTRSMPRNAITDYSAATDVTVVADKSATKVYSGVKLLRSLKSPPQVPERVLYFQGKVIWQFKDKALVEGSGGSIPGYFIAVSGNRQHAVIERISNKTFWHLSPQK